MEKRADGLRDILEEEILMGVLRPGDRLEEPALAERFGVSRTPIREALLHLAASGLIENRSRRGTFVARLGPRRLMEMFDVIAALEALAASQAARRATAPEIAAIRALHEDCAASVDADEPDPYYYANERFHAAIRQASGNGFLIEEADKLQKRLRPYRRTQLRAQNRIRASFAEHESILTAIEAGDAAAASATMHSHVAVQGERFTDLLASLEVVD